LSAEARRAKAEATRSGGRGKQTMALQVFDGFDHYNAEADLLNRSGFLQWTQVGVQLTYSFITGRQGFGKALNIVNGNLGVEATRAVWGARNAEAFIGQGLSISAADLAMTSLEVALFDGVAAGYQCGFQFNGNNFSIVAYRGSPTSNAVLGISANNVWTPDIWNFIEFHVKIDGSAGVMEVKVNGVTVLSLTGVNTQSTANAWFDGTDYAPHPAAGIQEGTFAIDDLYYCDTTAGPGLSPYNTFMGNCGTKTLFPIGNNSVQFSPQPNTNANWQNVAETAMDSDTTYNFDATVGHEDLLNFAALPSDTQSVLAVQVTGAYRKDDVGARSVRQPLKSGTTKVYGSTFSLPDNYAYFTDLYILDPNTSTNWTVAAVNAVSAGYNVAA
jgi:hypothetical protein